MTLAMTKEPERFDAPSLVDGVAEAGLTPLTFEGAAALYAAIASTPLGKASPERWAMANSSFDEVITDLAAVDRPPLEPS